SPRRGYRTCFRLPILAEGISHPDPARRRRHVFDRSHPVEGPLRTAGRSDEPGRVGTACGLSGPALFGRTRSAVGCAGRHGVGRPAGWLPTGGAGDAGGDAAGISAGEGTQRGRLVPTTASTRLAGLRRARRGPAAAVAVEVGGG